MGEAEATTEAKLSAINESLLQLTMKLHRIAARQDQMLVTLKNTTAALTPTATTRGESVPGRVMEQQTTKPSLPSVCSTNQIVSGGAPDADAVFASTMPTKCSALGSPVNVGSNHAAVAFSTSGTLNLNAMTSISSSNNTLQGVDGSGANTSAGCSTNILSCPPDDSVALPLGIDTDISAEVLTQVEGFSLFQEFEQNSAHEVFNDSPLKDVLWYEELTDCVFTHIRSSSLFLEQNMDTHDELEGGLDKPTRLKHGTGGVRVVLPVVLAEKCKLQQLRLRQMQYASSVASFFLSWDPGGCSLQLSCHTASVGLNWNCKVPFFVRFGFAIGAGDTLHHGSESVMVCDAQRRGRGTDKMRPKDYSANNFYGMTKKKLMLSNTFATQWDPGIMSRRVSYAIAQFNGFNPRNPVQLIPKCSKRFLKKTLRCTILPTARLKCKLFRTLIHKIRWFMVFSDCVVCIIQNRHINGLMPYALMQFISCISVRIVDTTSSFLKPEALNVRGVLMVALADQLRTTDLWTAEILLACYPFEDDLINVLGKPLNMITGRLLLQYSLQVWQPQVLHYCFTLGLESEIPTFGRAARYLGKLLVIFNVRYRGHTFRSLIHPANYLQYKQWDPGVL